MADAPGLPASPANPFLSKLIEQEYAGLLMRARTLCRNDADAHDLVQATAVRALERAHTFTARDESRCWLYTVLVNLFTDGWRVASRRPLSEELDPERHAAPALEPYHEPRWASVTPEQLRAALAQVDEPSRRVFELKEMEKLSYIQIAETLGMEKSTVGTRLLRTRRRLKELLLGAADDGSDHD